MGFLKNISQFFRSGAGIRQLPLGSMTVDRDGEIITSTVSSLYPKSLLQQIGQDVLVLFSEARAVQLPLAEVSIHFGSLHITAREMRGGAVIFLFPQTALPHTPN